MMEAKSFAPATCISIQYIAYGARRTDREYVYVWKWVGRSGTQDIASDFCIWHLAASTLHSTWVEKKMRRCLYAFLLLTLNLIILYDGNDSSRCFAMIVTPLCCILHMVCLAVCFVLPTYCTDCI